MRGLSRRARILLAGSVVGLLGSGLAGALMIPASAQASSAPRAQATAGSLVSVCLTVTEIHLGPVCIKVPSS